MLPENIDDLFRNNLDGHQTPPGDALWARLQALPADTAPPADAPAERLDQLFQQGLNAHATPPGRELWERLEDEHLRPRKRRALAWWPMALVAAVALLLVAGGAGLWLGLPWSNSQRGTVASQVKPNEQSATGTKLPKTNNPGMTGKVNRTESTAVVTAKIPAETPHAATAGTIQKNPAAQATRPAGLASTAPKASMAASGPAWHHPMSTTRQPDATADHRSLVARTTPRTARRPAPIRTTAADERRPAQPTAPVVAAAPKPMPAAEIVPAPQIPAASLASAGELITVDVRNGANPASRPAKTTSTALAAVDAPEQRRGLGGRLLHQAGNLVRGERVSLAEATGLPQNVTLRATVAGRSLTRSFQL